MAGISSNSQRTQESVYPHLAEGLAVRRDWRGGAPSLVLASALGHGKKFVPSLVEAQEQLTGARIVPR